LPASRGVAVNYAQPFIAATACYFVLREPITASVAIGGALVLGGLVLVGRG
jgi:drug/metabolite transporter (DMT)-like permease